MVLCVGSVGRGVMCGIVLVVWADGLCVLILWADGLIMCVGSVGR